MNESTMMTAACLPKAKTRVGLSLLAYHGVALIFALILVLHNIDVATAFFPMIVFCQIWAGYAWWSGAWLAPVMIDSRYQIRNWWLVGALGAGQTLAVLLVKHVALDRQPILSLVQHASLLEGTIIFSLYGAVSSLVYILLVRLYVKRKALAG